MGSQVLILTDDPSVDQSLGEWLAALEGVSPLFASEREDGLYIARTSRPQWIIVDADLAEIDLPGYLDSLLAEAKGAKILFLYPGERKTELPWLDLNVSDSLAKPFTKAEFLRSFGAFASLARPASQFQDRPTVPRPASKPSLPERAYPWLHDQNQALLALKQQLRFYPVHSVFLFFNRELWASSNNPTDLSASSPPSELLDYFRRIGIMQKISNGDLVRYVRLKSPDRLLLLYATRLVDDFNLALVMDAKTNFRDVREVAKRFSSGLLQPPGEGTEYAQEIDASGEPIKPDNDEIAESVDEEEVPVPKLSLGDVPVPTPESMRHAVPRSSQLNKSWVSRDSSSIHAETDLQNDWPAVEVGSEMRIGEMPYTVSGEESGLIVPDPGHNIQIAQTPGLPEAYEVIRTQTGPEQKFVMRVLSPAIYTLQYACLLLPRLPDHLLTGDLSVRLTYWLPRLMMAFGWRLERLAMQADYLHWIVSVPPEASAEYVLERTRIHTSEQIFQEFPRLKLENPSGDFWAPGYLVMTGTTPLPENVVRQYITHTRYRQGFSGDWQ